MYNRIIISEQMQDKKKIIQITIAPRTKETYAQAR